jgi:hypothetical protein
VGAQKVGGLVKEIGQLRGLFFQAGEINCRH